jgi:dolichol-phosphate mannosyltransferase
MSRPTLALLSITSVFVGFLGFFWLQQPPSNQELLANYSKVVDYAKSAASVHGLPWWTPNYLQGSSLAFLSLGALTSAALLGGGFIADAFWGAKIVTLGFLFLCPIAMFAFIRRLCPGSAWTASCCGAAYLFAPGILLRLGHVEHVANVLAFAMIPVAFRGVLVLFEERNAWGAIQCALANSLLVLAYAKIAVLVLPLLAAFAIWVWIARAEFTLPSRGSLLLCLGIFFVLACLPNLPSLRETSFVAQFDFGPFKAWQRGFSAESIISWLDRGSLLTRRPPSAQSDVTTGSSYLGVIAIACVTGLFFLHKRPVWQTPEAMVFRVFVALTLFAHWFGLGVNTAVSAQFAFLSHAGSAWDPAIAISWGLLALQGIAIWLLMPGSLPARPWWVAAAVLVYFSVPGFRFIERIPLYADIRAPHDFFEMGGIFCFSVAAGVAARLLVVQLRSRLQRVGLSTALLALACLDSATAVPSFFKGSVERQTFDDFLAVQKFLHEDPRGGRVVPYSGRYFYLLTPILSGRGLITEAFNSNLMQRGVAELQRASFLSRQDFLTFLNIAGVSHLLIDKKDPDTPRSLQESLRSLANPVFENEHFVVLANPDAFYPAAFAKYFLHLKETPDAVAQGSLAAAAKGVVTLSDRSQLGDNNGLVSSTDGIVPSDGMKRISAEAVTRKTTEEIIVNPPAEPGWLVIPEAFHPDWEARQAGRILEIAKAYGALIAIRLVDGTGEVVLSFRAPWWYFACIWAALAGWLGTGVLLIGMQFSLLPGSWQTMLRSTPASRVSVPTPHPEDVNTSRVGRVLVIIPTYNEAIGIQRILDKTLEADHALHVVVIDDSSPDQTAGVVRSHQTFGDRVHLVERRGKLGLGSAYKEGFRWAIERGFDTCIQIDADLSHDPNDIPRLLAALEQGADAAIGSRYSGGVRVLNWPQDRLFLSVGASKFVRALTSLPLTDATSGFKAIRCDVLRRLDWTMFRTEGYGFQVELHYFLWKSGAVLVEVPIVFTERRAGQTKMTAGIAIEAIWRVLQLAMFKR